jgi:2-dehydropantoate 2-reductase
MGKRIVVFGAGAVGGYVGAVLTESGQQVTLVDPWPRNVETIRASGVELSGMTEPRTVPVDAVHVTDVQAFSRAPIDIAIIAVKSYDTEWVATLARDYLAPDGYCVSMQNGINEDRLAGAVGWGRTMGCVVGRGLGFDLFEAGRIRRDYPAPKDPKVTSLHVGEVHGRITPRAQELAGILGAVATARPTENLWGMRWSKLCVNSMRNGVSAATGMGGNDRDRDDDVRRVCVALGSEAVRVGRALGYSFASVGQLDAETLARAGEGDADARAEVDRILLDSTRSGARSDLQRPSMAQDMAKGRRTEIEFISGLVAARGAAAGVPAPANAALTRAVLRVERGEVKAGRENVLGEEFADVR